MEAFDLLTADRILHLLAQFVMTAHETRRKIEKWCKFEACAGLFDI